MTALLRPRVVSSFSHPRLSPASFGSAVIFIVAISVSLLWGWCGLCSLRQQMAEEWPRESSQIYVPACAGPELEYWGLVR